MKLRAVTILTILGCIAASLAFRNTGNKIFDKIDHYLLDRESASNSGQELVARDGKEYRRGFENTDKKKRIVDVVNVHYSSTILDVASMDEHLDILGGIRKELSKFTFQKGKKAANAVILTFVSEDSFVDVILTIENGKIVGMRIDN